jgi:hypothetical protein
VAHGKAAVSRSANPGFHYISEIDGEFNLTLKDDDGKHREQIILFLLLRAPMNMDMMGTVAHSNIRFSHLFHQGVNY